VASKRNTGKIAAPVRRKKQDLMMEQEKVGKARMIGYGTGLAVFIVLAIWKFLVK
jgi:hypothetical protein